MRQVVIVSEAGNNLPEHFQAGSSSVYATPAVMEQLQYFSSSTAPCRHQQVLSGSQGMFPLFIALGEFCLQLLRPDQAFQNALILEFYILMLFDWWVGRGVFGRFLSEANKESKYVAETCGTSIILYHFGAEMCRQHD